MSDMARVLQLTSEKMIEMSHSSYLSVKRLLISSSWKYSHEPLEGVLARNDSPQAISGIVIIIVYAIVMF